MRQKSIQYVAMKKIVTVIVAAAVCAAALSLAACAGGNERTTYDLTCSYSAESGALEAAAFQLLVMAAVFCASVLSVLLAVTLTRRYMFDEYSRLKPLRGNGRKEVPATREDTARDADVPEEED